MTVEILIAPKNDEQKLADMGKEIVEAANRLGSPVQVEGFIMAWLSQVKVVVERDVTGKIVSLAFFTGGPRWIDAEVAVHILRNDGNFELLMQTIMTVAKGMGAEYVYYQELNPIEELEDYTRYVVRRVKVQ